MKNSTFSSGTFSTGNSSVQKQDVAYTLSCKDLPQSKQQSDTVFCKLKFISDESIADYTSKRKKRKELNRSNKFTMKQLDRKQDNDC